VSRNGYVFDRACRSVSLQVHAAHAAEIIASGHAIAVTDRGISRRWLIGLETSDKSSKALGGYLSEIYVIYVKMMDDRRSPSPALAELFVAITRGRRGREREERRGVGGRERGGGGTSRYHCRRKMTEVFKFRCAHVSISIRI